ncbi:hypothetical protein KQH21_11750 [Streptomyces sp. IpFD-1.1]|uniref:hypothetical protein n=1 Tax=unclassified Streptomyces TaxID=2593676 RepID=UPI001436B274|nr:MULTISPECIES: hypothetical protein [unclassified Streptomyces]MBV7255065.1 hypothetical protein [Streptomyces sp. S-2]MCO6748836.1 hypothetical protein [Streptomyces sp. IpFD-1.1]
MSGTDLDQRLLAANLRIEHGNAERAAGADQKAIIISEEVERRGRGGAKSLAAELGVSEKTISQAIARARRATTPHRQLPVDTLDRLLAVELNTVPPLPAVEWKRLAHLVRGIFFDAIWIEAQPGPLLADEVEEAAQDDGFDARPLTGLLRNLSRTQALAVIDACQSGDLAALPTT